MRSVIGLAVAVSFVVTAFSFWLLGRAGDGIHQSWDDVTCLSGAYGWAVWQAVVASAAAGSAGIAAVRAVVSEVPAGWSLVVSPLLLVAWLLLVTVGDPREDLGNDAGCGLG